MKQLAFLLFFVICTNVFSQAPQSIPYQAVVRNTDGSVMSNTALNMTFKIHDVTATGTAVYEESHTTSSNAQGLVALNVGGGTPITGTFNTINWGNGAKFLHVLMNAGNGIVDLGTQQMMSVPYALFADDIDIKVSLTGDSLFIGDEVSIVPGVSAANSINIVSNGSMLLPGNTTCQSEYISITGCNGQDNIFYHDRFYSLVEIAGQCWFAENLATDKYTNNDFIPTGFSTTASWINATNGAFDNMYESNYGKLYNFYAAVDSRGICPTGWHVPSDCEWMYLENNSGLEILLQQSFDCRGNTEGNSLMMDINWGSNINATNSTGFSALPGGMRFGGDHSHQYALGYWWTNSMYSNNNYIYRRLGLDSKICRFNNGSAIYGFSIRCIKD